MSEWDVIVAGGGPAGSTTAGFLTQMGRRVLVLERSKFPRHHIGESMIASTFDILAEIGLEEKIQAAGFPVKSGGCFVWGETRDPWCIRFDEIPGRPTSFQVKRDVFDTILLDHVEEMGAEVIQEARITEVIIEDERTVGVRYEHAGDIHEARAPYIVDASGLAAVVANKVSTRQPVEGLKNMALYGYWHGEHLPPADLGGDLKPDDRNNIIITMLDDGWVWFIPLGIDNLISVGFVTQRDQLPEGQGKAGLERHYLERVAASKEASYLLSECDYSGDFHTVKDWSYRSADMAGPGYFAVGDAACFVDPILSSGVYLGVLFAKMCAIGINTCLSDPSREALVNDWYEGLYVDAFTDYMEMAQLWYHGDRTVQAWMHRAQDQLSSEAEAVFTETDRSSFVGLATGNAHTHPNYVLQRDLASYPLPLQLRKDPASGFHKQAHAALLAHADPARLEREGMPLKEGAKLGLSSSADRRERILRMLAERDDLVTALDPVSDLVPPDEHGKTGLADGTRLSLEVLAEEVEMVLITPEGKRRVLEPFERRALRPLADRPELGDLLDLVDGEQQPFIEELVSAGVIVGD